MISAGVWQWRKSKIAEFPDNAETDGDEERLHSLAQEIANLDAAHERGKIDEESYHQKRTVMLKEAKALLKHLED